MSKGNGSFQENIRRTFIRYSIVPVAAVAAAALILFGISWTWFMISANRQENSQVSGELTRIINIYYEMMDDVKDTLVQNEMEIVPGDIFSIIYKRTAEFGEIGNLIILSGGHESLFSSKDYTPRFLTGDEYRNWGVWHSINSSKGSTTTILYDNNLCIAKGIYEGTSLKAAAVYIVPGDVISQAASAQNRYLLITDENGFVYAANTRKLQDEYGQVDVLVGRKGGFIKLDGRLCYSYSSRTGNGLVVYTINDISRSVHIIGILIGVIAVIFMAIALITVRSTTAASARYTKDIKKIEDAFEEVQNGNLDVVLDISSSTEFEIIASDFNEMLSGLKEQIEQNKELAENAAFSQVKQLESQFNPHFLFNTLDNIRFMARIDAKAADKMIVSLSGLLRYSIRETREEVSVREDLDNLQYYLNILQIRFNKRFAYSIDVSGDIMEFLIPKLLLQPLLENAVKYGFDGQEKLSVHIRGYQIREKLIFVCEDDGAGIENNMLKEIQKNLSETTNRSQHYGLYNIHRRIKLMYGDDYGLDISSSRGEGTTVRLTIPKKR